MSNSRRSSRLNGTSGGSGGFGGEQASRGTWEDVHGGRSGGGRSWSCAGGDGVAEESGVATEVNGVAAEETADRVMTEEADGVVTEEAGGVMTEKADRFVTEEADGIGMKKTKSPRKP